MNKRIIESLIYAGAFDSFGYARSQCAAVYEEAYARVNAMDKQKAGAQISLFGSIIQEQAIEVKFPNLPELETMEKLSKEKSVLGLKKFLRNHCPNFYLNLRNRHFLIYRGRYK